MNNNLILSPISLEQLKAEITEALKKEIVPLITSAMSPKEQDELVTRKEAAKILRVSLVTINDWTKTGKIKGHRIASRIRYKRNELEASLAQIKTCRTNQPNLLP